MKFNVLAGYLLALFLVGFFLWVIRGFIRALRQRDELPDGVPDVQKASTGESVDGGSEKIPVAWPFTLYLQRDDIEYPGRLESLTPTGAFLRCSAPLRIDDRISFYVGAPDGETFRISANVLWVAEGKGRLPVAQVRFEGMAGEVRERLILKAGNC